jgi:hypothetical protein
MPHFLCVDFAYAKRVLVNELVKLLIFLSYPKLLLDPIEILYTTYFVAQLLQPFNITGCIRLLGTHHALLGCKGISTDPNLLHLAL